MSLISAYMATNPTIVKLSDVSRILSRRWVSGFYREAMQSDILRPMGRELTEVVKKMPKLEWTQRESVRADLRRTVRRLLVKYGYPLDLAEGATQLVAMRQAELPTEHTQG